MFAVIVQGSGSGFCRRRWLLLRGKGSNWDEAAAANSRGSDVLGAREAGCHCCWDHGELLRRTFSRPPVRRCLVFLFRVVLVVEMNLSPSKMAEPSPESDGMSRITISALIQFRTSHLASLAALFIGLCNVAIVHCGLMFPNKLAKLFVHYTSIHLLC